MILLGINLSSNAQCPTEATMVLGGTFSFAGPCTINVGANINIAQPVILTGGGTFVINGSNNANGFLFVNPGGSITIETGTELRMDDQDLTIQTGGSITIDAGGTLTGDGGDDVIVQGTLTVNGNLDVVGDDLEVDGGVATVGATGIVTINGDDLKVFNGGLFNSQVGSMITVADRVGNSSVVPPNAGNASQGTIILNGTMTVGNTFGIIDTTPDSGLTGGGTLTVTGTFTDQENGDFSGCGGGASCLGSGPLPVELSFIAASHINGGVLIKWATATEETNSHFEVERSIDTQNFEMIDFVEGAGDSKERIDYEFIDHEIQGVKSENLYYRLKQIDFDGKFEYSRTVVARNEDFIPLEPNIWPNPFQKSVTVTLNSSDKEEITLTIFDLNGREVYTENRSLYNGLNDIHIDNIEHILNGTYLLMIRGRSIYLNQRLVKNN